MKTKELDIRGLNSSIIRKEEVKRAINDVEVFYTHFKESTMSHRGKRIIEIWVKTQKVLRKMFKYELGEKCKGCTHCCCCSCAGNIGYFSSFDYFMYKLRGLDYPESKGYIGKKGCTLDETKRSTICIFYSCKTYPLVKLLEGLWGEMKGMINEIVKNPKCYKDMYKIEDYIMWVLEEIESKYNPIPKINPKMLNECVRGHLDNLLEIKDNNIILPEIRKSIKYSTDILMGILEEQKVKKK